ncbi:MAG TPA: hypothetical protein VGM54_12160 [Chthoniobacter sp.]|jgi:hypothetical protein
MPAETAIPELSTQQSAPPPKRAAGIAAHLLVLVFTITGTVIQLFVPHFVEPLQQLGDQPLPFYTSALLRFQHLTLLLSAIFPAAVLYFAWKHRFKMPLSRSIVRVIVCAALLEGATAFALLKPMHGVIEAAGNIKPVGEVPK